MGYYSEVAITLYKEDFEALVEEAANRENVALNLIKNSLLCENKKSNIITIYWNSIKWYENYDDVRFIMSFIENNDTQYHFIRTGESSGDIEEESNDKCDVLCDSIYIETFINVENAGEEINAKSTVEKMLQNRIAAANEIDDALEGVTEDELFDVIGV